MFPTQVVAPLADLSLRCRYFSTSVHQRAASVSDRRTSRERQRPEDDSVNLRRQRAPKAISAGEHKLARIRSNLMRHGIGYIKNAEAAYAKHVRERLAKQLHRRAKELGDELRQMVELPDGEIVLVKPDGEIVES